MNQWILPAISAVFSGSFAILFTFFFINRFDENLEKNNLDILLKTIKKHSLYSCVIFLVTAALIWGVFAHYGINAKGAAVAVFALGLSILSFVDFKTQLLPNHLTRPLIVLGLIVGYFEWFVSFEESLLGAFLGYYVLWTINTIFRYVRKKEGMGYGDFKLLAAIGAWAGASMLPLVVFLASLFGVIVSLITMKLMSKSYSEPFPFGPSLAANGLLALVYGKQILDWYFGLFQPTLY